jgi:DNA-binding MarR family transcriptional regulator
MRLSSIQKDTLFVLLAIRDNGVTKPIPCTNLLSLLNQSRQKQVAASNFRTSCNTLVDNGLLHKYRNPKNLTQAYSLTDAGIELARKIAKERQGLR